MKKRHLLFVAVVLLFGQALPFASAQGNLQSVFNEGVQLYNEGKFPEALLNFEKVVQQRPDFVYARNYLAKCKTAIARGAGQKKDLEGRVAKIIIPEINFSEATLGDVLDYFSARSSELTGGETVVNFIYNGSAEQKQKPAITLSLREIPLTEALKYVGQMSATTIKYEEHAVVITPIQAGAPIPGANESPANAEPAKSPFD